MCVYVQCPGGDYSIVMMWTLWLLYFYYTDVVEVDDGWYYWLCRKAALLLLYPDRANIIRFKMIVGGLSKVSWHIESMDGGWRNTYVSVFVLHRWRWGRDSERYGPTVAAKIIPMIILQGRRGPRRRSESVITGSQPIAAVLMQRRVEDD